MYTELNLDVELSGRLPQSLRDGLTHLLDHDQEGPYTGHAHPFFAAPRADMAFWGEATTPPTLTASASGWTLHIDSDFKDYDGEIDLLLDLLSPYVVARAGEVVGSTRFEEWDAPAPVRYDGVRLVREFSAQGGEDPGRLRSLDLRWMLARLRGRGRGRS